jgi:hypothetical protein
LNVKDLKKMSETNQGAVISVRGIALTPIQDLASGMAVRDPVGRSEWFHPP